MTTQTDDSALESGLPIIREPPPDDNTLESRLPLISEELPTSLLRAAREKASKYASRKTRDHLPLITEVPPESLEANWPKILNDGDDLVTDFDSLLSDSNLVDYLLKSNTFFHGKIGFYKRIIDRIREDRNRSLRNESRYIHTLDALHNLDQKTQNSPLILLPIVESSDAFNLLVAKSFERSQPIWLIANPRTVHPHLLVAFQNFFITSSTKAELEYLQHVFQLPKSTTEMLEAGAYKAIVVTDYEPFVSKANLQTVVTLRLEKL